MLTEGVIVYPEIAQVIYVLSESAVILSLSHVQVCHARIAFFEAVHGKVISLRSDKHRTSRHMALLTLVVELAYRCEHLSSVIVLRLLHLSFYYLLCRLCFLYLSLSESPVEERDAECYAHHFLVKQVLVCPRIMNIIQPLKGRKLEHR